MQDWLSHNGEWPWLKTIIVNPADYHAEFAAVFSRLEENPDDQSVLDIIQNGVLKKVDEQYRTNGFRIYSGFMGNGAFGLYTLLNRPDMFNAYLIASPTLGNDFGHVVLDAPEKLQVNYGGMKFLYMTIGNHGYERSHVAAFKQFESELRKLPEDKLHWVSNNSEDHYYMSRPVITLLNGIEALFDDIHHDLPADSTVSKQGPDAIVNYYQKLSKEKYGFPVSAEGSLKALAQSLVEHHPEKALEIYIQVTKLYPESAYAHAALARAYADLGEIEKAITIQQVAVEKSKSMVQWHQNKHQQYLDELKAMLNE
jgi:tetratricopeptide (TPR) repeat protein